MAASGGWLSVSGGLQPLGLPYFQREITHCISGRQIIEAVGCHCPVFATPERPRITTESGVDTIYALFPVYAVTTSVTCRSRPTYLRTDGLRDGRTTRRIDHGTEGLPSLIQNGYTFHIIYTDLALYGCTEYRAASDNTASPEKPLCTA